jgi:hypothetical protein
MPIHSCAKRRKKFFYSGKPNRKVQRPSIGRVLLSESGRILSKEEWYGRDKEMRSSGLQLYGTGQAKVL